MNWFRKVVGHTVGSLVAEHDAILGRVATLKSETADAVETRSAAMAILAGEVSALNSLKTRLTSHNGQG